MSYFRREIVGWWDSATAAAPAHDPGPAPCPSCGEMVTPDNVRTVNVMRPGGARSHFYRLHQTCAEGLGPLEADHFDHEALLADDH